MSFADTAQHLIDSDEWLLETIRTGRSEQMVGQGMISAVRDSAEYVRLLIRLEVSGDRCSEYVRELSRDALGSAVLAPEFGPEVSLWWVIMRGAVDHEAHHRGQVVAYMRALKSGLDPECGR